MRETIARIEAMSTRALDLEPGPQVLTATVKTFATRTGIEAALEERQARVRTRGSGACCRESEAMTMAHEAAQARKMWPSFDRAPTYLLRS